MWNVLKTRRSRLVLACLSLFVLLLAGCNATKEPDFDPEEAADPYLEAYYFFYDYDTKVAEKLIQVDGKECVLVEAAIGGEMPYHVAIALDRSGVYAWEPEAGEPAYVGPFLIPYEEQKEMARQAFAALLKERNQSGSYDIDSSLPIDLLHRDGVVFSFDDPDETMILVLDDGSDARVYDEEVELERMKEILQPWVGAYWMEGYEGQDIYGFFPGQPPMEISLDESSSVPSLTIRTGNYSMSGVAPDAEDRIDSTLMQDEGSLSFVRSAEGHISVDYQAADEKGSVWAPIPGTYIKANADDKDDLSVVADTWYLGGHTGRSYLVLDEDGKYSLYNNKGEQTGEGAYTRQWSRLELETDESWNTISLTIQDADTLDVFGASTSYIRASKSGLPSMEKNGEVADTWYEEGDRSKNSLILNEDGSFIVYWYDGDVYKQGFYIWDGEQLSLIDEEDREQVFQLMEDGSLDDDWMTVYKRQSQSE